MRNSGATIPVSERQPDRARRHALRPCGYGAQWGYYADRETRLLLLTWRYYDAGTGRFLNWDPIGTDGGVNVYTYCNNRAAAAAARWASRQSG